MKNITKIGLISIALLFSACTSKDVQVDNSNKVVKKETTQSSDNLQQKNSDTQDETAQDQGVNTETSNSQSVATIVEEELENIYFNYNKYDIKSDMVVVIDTNNENIKNIIDSSSDKVIVLEGNCDPVGSDEYNYALGLKRANTVKSELISAGIDEKNIKTVTLGESNLVCSENTKECHAKNRRVEYKIK